MPPLLLEGEKMGFYPRVAKASPGPFKAGSWCLHVAWAGSKLTVPKRWRHAAVRALRQRPLCKRLQLLGGGVCSLKVFLQTPKQERQNRPWAWSSCFSPAGMLCGIPVCGGSSWVQFRVEKLGELHQACGTTYPAARGSRKYTPTPFPSCLFIFSTFRSHHLLYRNIKQQMIVLDTIVHSIVLLCPTLLIA